MTSFTAIRCALSPLRVSSTRGMIPIKSSKGDHLLVRTLEVVVHVHRKSLGVIPVSTGQQSPQCQPSKGAISTTEFGHNEPHEQSSITVVIYWPPASLAALSRCNRQRHSPRTMATREPGDDHRGPAVRRVRKRSSKPSNGPGNCIKPGPRHRRGDRRGRQRSSKKTPTTCPSATAGSRTSEAVVQLDSSVMHGPTHKAGCVACIEDIKTPASVALEVLRRTDHVMLVGQGAKEFAVALGFKEENLLTDRASKGLAPLESEPRPKRRLAQPRTDGLGIQSMNGHGTHTAIAQPQKQVRNPVYDGHHPLLCIERQG